MTSTRYEKHEDESRRRMTKDHWIGGYSCMQEEVKDGTVEAKHFVVLFTETQYSRFRSLSVFRRPQDETFDGSSWIHTIYSNIP